MSAAEALKAARSAGVQVAIDGDDLVLESSAPPPSALLDLLSRHKGGIVTLLRPAYDGWSAQDWQISFDQRAAIAEFEGGLPRAEARARAFACCLAYWLKHNPARSQPGRCLGRGGDDHSHDPLLPFGQETNGLAWLHHRCWPVWYQGRKAEAIAALAAMGIEASADPPDNRGKNGDS